MQHDAKRWPNFPPNEIACHCCGELVIDEAALDAMQRMRNMLAAPIKVVCGHRCAAENERVGGAANSQHLKLAFDLAIGTHDRAHFYALALRAGFRGFGFMEYGLHVDTRAQPANWDYGPKSRQLWKGIIPEGTNTFEPHPHPAVPGST